MGFFFHRFFRPPFFVPGLLLPLLVCALLLRPVCAGAAETYRIVAGSGQIADIVRDLLSDSAEVDVLMPPSADPFQVIAVPPDAEFFASADMVIVHHWQIGGRGLSEAVRRAALPVEAFRAAQTTGFWLVPEQQRAASAELAGYLSALPGADRESIGLRLEGRLERVDLLADECRQKLAPFSGRPVCAIFTQLDFIRWAGLAATLDFPPDSDAFALDSVSQGSRQARTRPCRLVIDAPEGSRQGRALAKTNGAIHLPLDVFPGGRPETGSYESLLRCNTDLLVDALSGR